MADSDGLGADVDSLLDHGYRPKPQTPCQVATALEMMDEDTRRKMVVLLDERFDVPSAEISRLLKKWGFEIRYPSVTRHRRRKTNGSGCICP